MGDEVHMRDAEPVATTFAPLMMRPLSRSSRRARIRRRLRPADGSIDGRMDDGVVPIQNLFWRLAIPAPGIVLKRSIEIGVGTQRSQKGGL